MARPVTRPPDYMREVGHRLRLSRLALGMTAAALCRDIDVNRQTYSQWENGIRLLDVLAAIRLKKRHGVTLDWLYDGDWARLPARLATLMRDMERL